MNPDLLPPNITAMLIAFMLTQAQCLLARRPELIVLIGASLYPLLAVCLALAPPMSLGAANQSKNGRIQPFR